MTPDMSDSLEQTDLPPQLTQALREAYTHGPIIPAAVEDSILAQAHEKFTRRRRLRLMARWGTGLAAGLAATIVLVVWLHHPKPAQNFAKGDINRDGQVNMIDALVLAKHLATHEKSDQTWDINGDGRIDQKDVDAIAAASVSLKQTAIARKSLPKFDELRIPNVGIASASGTRGEKRTLAEASPARTEDRP
jgi:hypothetical protein